VSTYFIEGFGEKKLAKIVCIPLFKIRYDLVEHIHRYEKKWHRIGYRDERVWMHMFANTLDEIPNKWYKIEESCGHTLNCSDIKENFIKDFEFTPEEEHLREASQQIKIFIENPTLSMQK
jgi:hypothetical protein